MKLRNIIICNIFCFLLSFDINYSEFTQSSYKSLNSSSELNFQITSYDNSYPLFGIQWWVSDNLQLSGNIQVKLQTKDSFNYLYNNIAVGYYNSSIKWLYSSSNFIQLGLHSMKYSSPAYKWIHCSYKSRYNMNNIIIGYDINYCFWGDNGNSFPSFTIAYNIKNKIIAEFKIDLINKDLNRGSFNLSIPI